MKLGAPEPIAALNRVRIAETGEPLVDIRDFCPAVQVMEQACPYLRRTVAAMLNRAQTGLPPGHVFRVGTALRTFSIQKSYWDGYAARLRGEHPEWSTATLRRAVNRFFAPYDQPAPPGHCTGGAVDVSLLGPDGEPLDTTSPLQGWDAAYTWTDRISAPARANRMIIVETMLGAGFSNCREEFWHYSYGDSAWAVRVGEQVCPYGLVKPAPVVEARFEGAQADGIRHAVAGEWIVTPHVDLEGAVRLLVGVFWSEGGPLTLRIGPPAPAALFTSSDRKEWRQVEAVEDDGQAVLRLSPDVPRLYVASHAPIGP